MRDDTSYARCCVCHPERCAGGRCIRFLCASCDALTGDDFRRNIEQANSLFAETRSGR